MCGGRDTQKETVKEGQNEWDSRGEITGQLVMSRERIRAAG